MDFIGILKKILIAILGVVATAVLIASCMTTIYYDMHEDVDFPHYKSESLLYLGVSVLVVFVIFFLAYKRDLFYGKGMILFALGFCLAYCLTLIFAIKPLPVNDSKLIDDALLQFEQGDYSSLTNAGGYLFTWPFQLGYFLFGQTMDRFFGHGNYLAWDIVQVLAILITVYVLYLITWELFEDRRICGIMALLSVGMLFFYNYSTYIYGDILSMGPQTLALYFAILYAKRGKLWNALFSIIAISLAVMLKTNCEITAIAIGMVFLLSAFERFSGEGKNRRGNRDSENFQNRLLVRIMVTALMVAAIICVKNAVNSYYVKLTGIAEIPGGSPSASHIAMGIQESELENGWYNGYNYKVFAENDYDTDRTRAAAVENIKERVSYFIQHPGYTARFFGRKFMTQWADPVCVSTHNLDLVSRHVENPTKLKDFLVFGMGSTAISWIMNVFMSVCYLCVVIYFLFKIRDRDLPAEEMLLLILLFGGMAFHMFWEGSSRYVMRYYVYWLPYAAWGMKRVLSAGACK